MPLIRPGAAISFKNILFLTDFGQASWGALAYSLAFARYFKARLYPAHVMDTEFSEPPAAANDAAVKGREEQKCRQLSRLVEYNGINFHPLVSRCDFEASMAYWISEHSIDLIVAGTHGWSGVSKYLLGSTSEVILNNAPCPVLTVGPDVDVPRLFSLELNSILLATDLGTQSRHVLGYALRLARDKCARMMLLHVLPEESQNYPDRSRLLSFTLSEMEHLLPTDASGYCKPEMAVDAGLTAERIVMHARNEKADLIVMGRACNADFSTTGSSHAIYKVISSASCPVLSVPEAWTQGKTSRASGASNGG